MSFCSILSILFILSIMSAPHADSRTRRLAGESLNKLPHKFESACICVYLHLKKED